MNSGDLSSRDRAILTHIARYRLTFKEILAHLYFEGADPQKTLDRLRDDGYIVARKGFGGNRSAYQLVPRGARAIGASKRRSDTLGPAARPMSLAILAFCFMQGRRRLKLAEEELAEVFPEGAPTGWVHCLERRRKLEACLHHVYLPDVGVTPLAIVAATRKHVEDMSQSATLRPWLDTRLYVHTVLVEAAQRAAEINAAFDTALLADERPLREAADINVECLPDDTALQERLHALA